MSTQDAHTITVDDMREFWEADPLTRELIETSFVQDLLLLIRYRTGDTVSLLDEPGSSTAPYLFPVAERLEGRLEDYTYKPDGEAIPPALVTFPFKHAKEISACRLVQHDFNHIEILVQTRGSTERTSREMVDVVEGLKDIYGKDMEFQISVVEGINTSPSGKFRWIECRIKK